MGPTILFPTIPILSGKTRSSIPISSLLSINVLMVSNLFPKFSPSSESSFFNRYFFGPGTTYNFPYYLK
jgi:hypothetical protein